MIRGRSQGAAPGRQAPRHGWPVYRRGRGFRHGPLGPRTPPRRV